MRIGIYIENYIAGGVETVVCNKIKNWPNCSDTFHIIVNEENEGIEKIFQRLSEVDVKLEITKVTNYSIPKLTAKYPRLAPLIWFIGIYLRHIYVFLNYLRLNKLYRTLELDALFIHNGGYPGGYSCFSAVLAGQRQNIARMYYVIHNLAAQKHIWQLPFDYFYDKLVIQNTELIFVSKASKISMIKNRGIGTNAHMIHNGVDQLFPIEAIKALSTNFYKNDQSKTFQIAMVARFDESKGHKILFQALKLLKKDRYLNIKLNLYGSSKGEKAINVIEELDRYDLSDLCHVHNFVDNVQTELLKMDCLILPSLGYESLPMSIIEAMSVGLPVIASDVGGVPELLRNEIDGLIVPAGDPIILSEKILDLYIDISKREKMKKNIYNRYIERFLAKSMSIKYYQLIQNAKY